MQQEVHLVQDNKEDLVEIIPSQEDQAKIIAEIIKEETLLEWSELKNDQDAIFLEDDPDKALQKLLSLQEFQFDERVVYVRHLSELIQLIGDQGIQNLEPILQLKDSNEIKKMLLTQISSICQIVINRKDSDIIMKSCILPCLYYLLDYDDLDIKEQAAEEIAKIALLLSKVDQEILILRRVITMAHDKQESNKIVAAQLLGNLSVTLGKEICESFIMMEMLSLGEDSQYRVRKEVILQLPKVGGVLGQTHYVQKLLPFFIQKCMEKTWQVRKACAEVMTDLSRLCTSKTRENELTKQVLFMLKDNNKWVKGAAYKHLGSFIETLFGSQSIDQKLLVEFCRSTADDVQECFSLECELPQACSYNFPAVLRTFGPQKWPLLQSLFIQLVKHKDPSVRKPLACSLHEVAKILGPQIAQKDLIIILDGILKDKNDEVKYGSIKNLWRFLEVFGTKRRESLLDVFLILQKDQRKWRIRELIARQIDGLVTIFDAEMVFKIILPISLKLCNDLVAQVRKQAANKVYALIECFLKHPDEMTEIYKECVNENLKAFAQSSRFNQRQAFARMCKNLMTLDEVLFQDQFMESMTKLAQDPVRNVRITIASVVSKHIKSKGKLINNLGFLNIVTILKKDQHPQIIHLMK